MIQEISAFFSFGAIGFFILLTILSIVFTIAVENDQYITAIIMSLISIGIYCSDIVLILPNWKILLLGIFCYGVIGSIWSIYRWFNHCKQFIKKNPYDTRPSYHSGWTLEEYYTNSLNATKHKSRITGWIVFWPWSLTWNLLGNTVTSLYDLLSNIYTNITTSVIKKAIKSSIK